MIIEFLIGLVFALGVVAAAIWFGYCLGRNSVTKLSEVKEKDVV